MNIKINIWGKYLSLFVIYITIYMLNKSLDIVKNSVMNSLITYLMTQSKYR